MYHLCFVNYDFLVQSVLHRLMSLLGREEGDQAGVEASF